MILIFKVNVLTDFYRNLHHMLFIILDEKVIVLEVGQKKKT